MSCLNCTIKDFSHLPSDSFYIKKLKLLKFDPYHGSKCKNCFWMENRAKLPSLDYCDLYSYMVGKHKNQEYRVIATNSAALKSLSSYDQFSCGWVRNVRVLNVDEVLCVVMANVSIINSVRLTIKSAFNINYGFSFFNR